MCLNEGEKGQEVEAVPRCVNAVGVVDPPMIYARIKAGSIGILV